MALSAKLEFRQSQSLVMTPQLMQAIKLLQLSSMDLVSFVEAELERNPLLEREDVDETWPSDRVSDDRGAGDRDTGDQEAGDSRSGEAAGGDADGRAGGGGDSDAVDSSAWDAWDGGDAAPPRAGQDSGDGNGETVDWLDTTLSSSGGDMEAVLDTGLANVFPDEVPANALDPDQLAGSAWSSVGTGGSAPGDDRNLEAVYAADISLADHLSEQLVLSVEDPFTRLIGRYLIDCLDDSGYLRTDLEEIADRLGTSAQTVEKTLFILQTFDPVGVFARDVKECLALQLRDKDRYDPAMQALVENLELLARRDFAQLKRICGVDQEDFLDMFEEIKALDPKPGNAFGSVSLQPVVPDVLVRAASDGGWQVELNTETLPRVLVNQTYYASLPKAGLAEKDKEFLSDCLQTASWLVKSLDQRAKTILRVSTEIVRQQDAFLAYGVEHLRPLNLKAIAEAIEMHESTVSRVTSNKYMATPRGIYELKFFFTSAISATGGGDAHSAESVRYKIKQLIDNEDPDAILSDDSIVTLLKGNGVEIARRTVAKYREALGITSSVQRRREKRSS